MRFPEHLDAARRDLLLELATRNTHAHGDGFLGLILTGSAGRGLMTERSDLDVYVVLTDQAAAERRTDRSTQVDEIPVSWSELETLPAFGTEDWYHRWSFAWAPILLDATHGRLAESALRQATLDPGEQDHVLYEADRLDGWLNFAYRALKNERDGRILEARLDATESVPWLLDTLFAVHGRVRPYNKYLPWELRTHPLPGWPADITLDLVDRTVAGDPAAVRETYARMRSALASYDRKRGTTRATDTVLGWGTELRLFD